MQPFLAGVWTAAPSGSNASIRSINTWGEPREPDERTRAWSPITARPRSAHAALRCQRSMTHPTPCCRPRSESVTSERRSNHAGAHRVDGQLLRELLVLVADGDRAAFTRLYDLTSSRIYGLAVRIVRDRHYAEEIVQGVYAVLAER